MIFLIYEANIILLYRVPVGSNKSYATQHLELESFLQVGQTSITVGV